MSTRTKLLLSALGCILCIVLLFSSNTPQRPFARLTAEDILSVELETELGLTVMLSDTAEFRTLSESLNRLTVHQRTDTRSDLLAAFSISVQDGRQYLLDVYDGFIRLDGVFCSADPTVTQELADFARRFA